MAPKTCGCAGDHINRVSRTVLVLEGVLPLKRRTCFMVGDVVFALKSLVHGDLMLKLFILIRSDVEWIGVAGVGA